MIAVHRIALDGPPRPGCARDAVEAILAAELGHPPEIVRGEHGKPALAAGGPAFNLAHSGSLALIAVGPDPLGVDVEQHVARRDVVALARRFFTPAEAAVVDADRGAFWRLWCRKEAWFKAHGTGLVLPLDEIDVRGDVVGWLLADVDVGAGYAAAVACAGGGEVQLVDHARSEDIRRSGSAIIARSTSR